MALARWQRNIVNDAGNVQGLASIEVRVEAPGAPLAPIFSDRAGLVALSNPFNADGDGFAAFHAAGGSYKITATKGGYSRTWRYVGVGSAQESDGFAQSGLAFAFSSATADADPGDGFVAVNNASLSAASFIYISKTDRFGAPVGDVISRYFAAANVKKAHVRLAALSAPVARLEADVHAPLTDGGDYWKIPLHAGTVVGFAGAPSAGEAMGFIAEPSGSAGINPSFDYVFDTGTADADPGAGRFRFNNADPAAATFVYISETDGNGADMSADIESWDDVGGTDRARLFIFGLADKTHRASVRISGAVIDAAGYKKIPVTGISDTGNPPFANDDPCVLAVTIGGAPGSVAGTDRQVQFNDGGAFAGRAGFEFEKTTDELRVIRHLIATQLNAFADESAVALTANQTSWAPTGLGAMTMFHVTPNADGYTIEGIDTTSVVAGDWMIIRNVHADHIINVLHESANATASKRLDLGKASIALGPGEQVDLQWETIGGNSRWRLMRTTAPTYQIRTLTAAVGNNNAVANTLEDVTGLGFPIPANKSVRFRARGHYTAPVATTGSRWTINGPAGAVDITYDSDYSLTATTRTPVPGNNAYQLPAASNASSSITADNSFFIEGTIINGATAGVIQLQHASEVANSLIEAQPGAFIEWRFLN